MNKDIVKEIFLLVIEIIKALCEMLWRKAKECLRLIWDRFFGMSDVSSREQAAEQEWGVTGEDVWPVTQEAPPVIPKEPLRETEREVVAYAPKIPELPDGYGDNRIILMVRDSLWLFTYWEIRKDVVDGVLNTLGSLAHNVKTVLRVYDVTDIIFHGNNAHAYFDIEVTGGARQWYMHVGKLNRSFCVDIGFLAPNGTFRILSRSNTVRTPRTDVSEIIDEKWMSIEELYKNIYAPMGIGISEFAFKRADGKPHDVLREEVSSPDSLSSLAASKK